MFQNESNPNFHPNPKPQPQPEPQRPFQLPPHNQEVVRVILLGDYGGIINTIHQFAAKGLADPNQWCPLVPTGRPGEYLTIHTRRSAPSTDG